jgi:Siphovirus Gp157
MTAIEFQVRAETEVARCLVADLKTYFGEDAPLLTSAIEGETSLFEAIDAVIAEIDEVDVLVTGLREKEAQFTARRRGMEERVRRLRALVEQAMATAEQHSIRRPSATLSLRRLPPDVVVMSEAEIPAEFFLPQPPPPPKLDKAGLRAALNACAERLQAAAAIEDALEREAALERIQPVPGAMLSNGGFSLQIRRV